MLLFSVLSRDSTFCRLKSALDCKDEQQRQQPRVRDMCSKKHRLRVLLVL